MTDNLGNLDTFSIPSEHEDSLDLVRRVRDGPSVDELVANYVDLIQETNTKAALERITLCSMFNAVVTNMPIRDDTIGLPPALHDYVVGLIIAHTGEGSKEHSYRELVSPALDISLAYLFSEVGLSPESSKEDELKHTVEFSMLQRELATGRFMMSDQPIEVAKKAYSPHNKYLKRELGLTIEEAIQSTDHIEEIAAKCRRWLIGRDEISLKEIPAEGHTLDSMINEFDEKGEIQIGSGSDDFKRDAELVEQYYHQLSDYHHTLSLTESVLVNHLPDDLAEPVFINYLDRMSVEIESAEDSKFDFKHPYQFNPLHRHPILQLGSRYFIPRPNAVRRALVETFYYDLIELPDYGDPSGETGGEFGRVFGDYVENWTYSCLSKVFGESNVFLNPLYPDSLEEACDVLVFAQDMVLIIECKSGKLPLSTRRGEYDKIQSAINRKIGRGYTDQALELVKRLRDEGLDELIHDGAPLTIEDYPTYQPMVVVGEPYDSIATHLIDVIVDVSDVPPYVADIYDLQILTEVLNEPDRLKHYIQSRLDLFEQRSIVSPDEIDYLGLYIENEDEFPDLPDNNFSWVEDMSHVVNSKIDYKFGF